ncbi:MAG: decaprenyl-phosphate phosphoribosyltransferase [Candidatus Omnitrophica bacterium]|nr:decaprenyl-phosphate phosphoribosyltransferase [Candidatus Omnitrophota bacterium]
MIAAFLDSLRVRQWLKNVVIMAPLIFSAKMTDPALIADALFAVGIFCMASSGVYLMNDLLDRRVDRFHPMKRNRPIAAEKIPLRQVWVLSAALMAAAEALAYRQDPRLGGVLLVYLAMNAAYSAVLKKQVILDAMTISGGFVVRVWAGAVAVNVIPSHWLQLSMFFLGLFLGLSKRRQELAVLHSSALRHRKVLSDYSPAFIDQLTAILTASAILCYALYCVSPEVTSRVGQFGFIYTVPFVVYGIFRYLYLMHIQKKALDPTDAVLSDPPLLLALLLWIGSVILTLYR